MLPLRLLPDFLEGDLHAGWIGPICSGIDNTTLVPSWPLPENWLEARLPLQREEVRLRLVQVLEKGMRCTGECGGNGEYEGAPGEPSRVTCPTCKGKGFMRPPTPSRFLLAQSEGGEVPAVYAQHVPALLHHHAITLSWGGSGIRAVGGPPRAGSLGYERHVIAAPMGRCRGDLILRAHNGRMEKEETYTIYLRDSQDRVLSGSGDPLVADRAALDAGVALIDGPAVLRVPVPSAP
jgi:hypothetical protein